MKQPLVRWFGIGGAVVVGLLSLWIANRSTRGQSKGESAASSSPTVRAVEVVHPQRMTLTRTLDVPATLQAYEETDLYAKVSGYVADLRVDLGSRVKTGDILLTMDIPEMADELRQAEAHWEAKKKAAVVQAEAQLATARAEVQSTRAENDLSKITRDRKKQLLEQAAIPQQEFDEAQSRLDVADAKSKIAEAMVTSRESDVRAAQAAASVAAADVARTKTLMDYATIRAPFDGVITQRMADRGTLVQSATSTQTKPLFSLQRADTLRIAIDVPESDLAFIRVGTPVSINPYGFPKEVLRVAISRIASALNPSTRTMRAEIDLPNADDRLMPGMYAQVAVELERHDEVLAIPAAALMTEAGQTLVFVARGDRAARTPVKTGLDDGIVIEIVEGLSESDLVILAGKGLVSEGSAVRPVLKGGGS